MTSTTVTVYRNGDPSYPGKKVVVNPRQIRTWDALLDRVTTLTNLKSAARSIKTPTGRHTIKQLDRIEPGGCYVAVGPEPFKKLPYTEIKVQPKFTPKKDVEITPVKHSRLQMSGRARKVAAAESTSYKIIHVYRNGDENSPSTRILLDKRALISLENVLKTITSKFTLQTGGVFWLFTMEGKEIKEPSELENGCQYVAVGHGKIHKKVAYNDHGNSLTPRSKPASKNQQKIRQTTKLKPNRTAFNDGHPNTSRTVQRKPSTGDSSSKTSTVHSPREFKPTTRSLVEQEQLVKEEQEEYISQPSIGELLMDKVQEFISQSPSNEESRSPTENVYKASGKEQEIAKEVQEDKDVKEDKPIDQIPAEEVEEDIEENYNNEENDDDVVVDHDEVKENSQDNQ